jgi:hypothetical protein
MKDKTATESRTRTRKTVISEPVETALAEVPRADERDSEFSESGLIAPATLRAYTSSWALFTTWCDTNGYAPLPAAPETIIHYLREQASEGIKPATWLKICAAISFYHRQARYDSASGAPAVRRTLKMLRRRYGSAQSQKAPLLTDELKDALTQLPETLAGKRDAALLLLGFAGAFRRSELAALDVEDLEETRQGLLITLRRSKTDQEGKGRIIAIPFGRHPESCPVRAVRNWREIAAVHSGPLLRSVDRHGNVGKNRIHPETVAAVVKKICATLGLNPERYAGHSLRAGLVTSAVLNGSDDRSVMRQTGHKSREMVDRYHRAAHLWRDNAATQAGL